MARRSKAARTGPRRAATGRAARAWLVPDWLRREQRQGWRRDVLAGLTLAVMLVPQALAYAALAGMPPITGLYAALVALVVYAWLGSSAHLSFGPVALVALLTAGALEPLADGDPQRFVALAGALALLVGGCHLLLALLRAGAVVELLSHPVIVGFTAGAGVLIGLSQLADLAGTTATASRTLPEGLVAVGAALAAIHPPTLVVGLTALGLVLVGRWLAPRLPAALLVSGLAILAAVVLDLDVRGVAVVGPVPAGLPRPRLPVVSPADLVALLPAAAVIAALSYAESISIAKAIAARTRQRLVPGRELTASGAANLAAGLVGAFPVAGSFTRSAVAHSAGARTQLAGVVAAGGVLLTLVLLTPALAPLPRAVLAAIVVVAVVGLVDLRAAREVLRVDRADAVVLLGTFAATLGLGVELGLLAGVIASLVVHVVRGMRPALVVLGRVPGTRLYRDVRRYPTVTDPTGVILRLDGPLDFLSVHQVTGTLQRLAATRPGLRWLVLDASGVTGMDATGVRALEDIQVALADAEVALHLATLRGAQRDVVARAGLWSRFVADSCHADIPAALAAVGLPETAPVRTAAPAEQPPDGLW